MLQSRGGSASRLIGGINGSEFVKNFTKFLATPAASAVWVKHRGGDVAGLERDATRGAEGNADGARKNS